MRPASVDGARRFETGTPSFEAQAGFTATVDYLAWLGGTVSPAAVSRRARIVAALEAATAYEDVLGERLLARMSRLNGVRLFAPPTMEGRVPTFGFTLESHAPADVARRLAECGIFAWSGHFYAVEATARLGLAETGGLVLVGLRHYNTDEEVDGLLTTLGRLAS